MAGGATAAQLPQNVPGENRQEKREGWHPIRQKNERFAIMIRRQRTRGNRHFSALEAHSPEGAFAEAEKMRVNSANRARLILKFRRVLLCIGNLIIAKQDPIA